MFWKRVGKTVRVELVNLPSALLVAPATEPVEVRPEFISFDAWLKLCLMLVAVTNFCLLAAGYMRRLGEIEAYGIQRSEVSFSISDLLASGYALVLKPATAGLYASCIVGGGLAVACVILVGITIREGTSIQRTLLSWVIAMAFVVALYAPLTAYLPGKESAFRDLAPALQVESSKIKKLEKVVEIPTNEGPLKGDLVLATPDYVFLRVDTTLYKITADTNLVVRKIFLSLPVEPSQPAPPQ